ncbi:MAG: ATP-binding protein [Nitrospira sp.]|nr:ATP-binding protein [Nitrospira sp.]
MECVPVFPLALADQLSDGIIVATEAGLRYVNPSGLLLLGAERLEQVIGKPLSMFFGPDTISKLPQQAELRQQDGRQDDRGATITGYLFGLDGSRVEVSLSSFPLQWEGASACLLLIREATTDRHPGVRAVMADVQRRAESKMHTIGLLAAGIIHEVNNTLTAVLGYGQLALKLIPADSKAHRYVQQVIASGRKSSELIQQILMFVRPGPENKGPLSLHVLTNEFLALLRFAIPSWIEVKDEIAAVTSPIEADPAQMRQLLAILVADAVHAMRRTGGVLHIELHDEDVPADQATPVGGVAAGRYVCLRVTDSGGGGGGMDPQEMRRLLDPSETSDALDRERELRRSAVVGIVSAHGGTVTVDGSPESGTRVSIFFPAMTSRAMREGENQFSPSLSRTSACRGAGSGFPEPLMEESDAVGPRD